MAAAGDEVLAQVEADLKAMAQDRGTAGEIRNAANNLRLAVNGSYQGEMLEAVAALRERESTPSDTAALADFRGRLADLLDLLATE